MRADVTYGTNNEFGFDYLRDNLVIDLAQRVQRGHFFAIVDEVDNILIDEARTPLIISGQAEESADKYVQFARLTPRLKAEEDYIVDEKFKQVAITEAGTDKMEGWLGVDNLFGNDFSMARHLEQALKAEVLYQRDRDYVVKDGEVIIVDEFTGRLMPGRRWSEGLHQAVEAKEGVKIQNESRTLATVTFQNYFRMYDKLAGMTGTAETEAEEFSKIYELEVVVVPTNRDMIRDDFADLVFRNQSGKWNAVIDEIAEEHEKGRPVLVGTISVAVSEMLGDMLKRRGIKHSVLNAKFHEKEAEIVAQAGRSGAVTIATNMAGRGTDILLGGNPEVMAAEILHKAGTNLLEASPEQYQAALAEADQVCAADRDRVHRGRRPAHRRHRAARGAAHRQPAARPRRPAGRPGQQPLLPVAGGRPDAALRVGSGQQHHGPPGLRRRDGARVGHGQPHHRGRADPGRGLQLRRPQARRPVRRRHQPPARDDLPRARADPALEGPVADHPDHARRGGPRPWSWSTARTTATGNGTARALKARLPAMAPTPRAVGPGRDRRGDECRRSDRDG